MARFELRGEDAAEDWLAAEPPLEALRAGPVPACVGNVVHEVRLGEVVTEEVHRARRRVDLRVRGHVARELLVEVVRPDGRQVLSAQLVGQSDLAERQRLAGVVHDRHVAQS